MTLINLAEKGNIPDFLIRFGIRRLLAQRLRHETMRRTVSINDFVEKLRQSPLAVETDKANEQHYEVPAEYFRLCLGPRLKYSGAYWPEGVDSLGAAEEAMLQMTCARAGIENGQRILELGCGWGSFTLWVAEKYPDSQITGVSNSHGQREFIVRRAEERGLKNVEIITCDMNNFSAPGLFDRVVSIEMFEHMKNYRKLLARIASWLNPGGKLFVHIFTHRLYSYPFEDSGEDHDWMARYFFTGGNMPGDELLLRFQEDLRVEKHWRLNGVHYSKTLEAWLRLQDEKRATVLALFEKTYGSRKEALLWFQRWRIFYMACSELFKYEGGEQWMVSHYLFRKP
jgi:cyclopropane-fatty-acyl-phospholipid synthase